METALNIQISWFYFRPAYLSITGFPTGIPLFDREHFGTKDSFIYVQNDKYRNDSKLSDTL